MRNRIPVLVVAVFILIGFLPPALAAESGGVDLSCVKHFVRAKTIITDRYKEYDVVLHNQCPGPVYWSMCIDRIDPWSRQIVESHTPTGYLEAEQKSRVNMQMKKGPENRFRNRYQEFYVNLGFAIDSAAQSPCHASQCETRNQSIIKQRLANETAWKKAKETLAARLENECPDSGWDDSIQKNCKDEVRAGSRDALDQYEQTDLELSKKLAEAEPAYCRLYGGALVTY